MLVLSRFINESIIIRVGNDEIRITLVDILQKQKARIGITAPKHVTINREEIQQGIDSAPGSKE